MIRLLTILTLTLTVAAQAQDSVQLTMGEALQLAVLNNSSLRANELTIAARQELIRTGYNWNKTYAYFSDDQANIAENGAPISVWGLRQEFEFPSVYHASKLSLVADTDRARWRYELAKLGLMRDVAQAYAEVSFYKTLDNRYSLLDSLYQDFAYAARRRFETGESNYLEQITAEAKEKEVKLLLLQNRQELESAQIALQGLIQSDSIILTDNTDIYPLEYADSSSLDSHPGMMMYNAARESAEWVTRSEKNRLLPDLAVEYFQGTNSVAESKIYRGFEIGIAIPIFFGPQKGRIRSGSIQESIIEKERLNYLVRLRTEQEQLVNQLEQIRNALDFYESNGRNLARELIRASQRSYQEGEINYFQYIQNVDSAVRMEIAYLENVLKQNLTTIALYYLAPDP